WDAQTGKPLAHLRGHTDRILTARFPADGDRVVTIGRDSTARVWDVKTGKELVRCAGHAHWIMDAAFAPDGKHLLTASYDGPARLWDIATPAGRAGPPARKELCRLAGFRDGTWAVVDPVGRYDAANGGEVNGLHWVVGREPIALHQLKDRYYDPGLLAK